MDTTTLILVSIPVTIILARYSYNLRKRILIKREDRKIYNILLEQAENDIHQNGNIVAFNLSNGFFGELTNGDYYFRADIIDIDNCSIYPVGKVRKFIYYKEFDKTIIDNLKDLN